MRPQSIKTFQDLCLVAYLWNIISFSVLCFHDMSAKWATESAGAATHYIAYVLSMGVGLIFLAPIMGMPYWFALLVARAKSQIGKYLLYVVEIGLVIVFLGWLITLFRPNEALEHKVIGAAFAIETLIIGIALAFLWLPESRRWLKTA